MGLQGFSWPLERLTVGVTARDVLLVHGIQLSNRGEQNNLC